MATFKTTKATNNDAQPPVHNESYKSGGKIRVWKGTHEITAAYTTADILVLDRIPWNISIDQIWLGWDDLNSSTLPADLGWYYPDGTVGDVDEFASSVPLGTGTVMSVEEFEAAGGDIDRMGKLAWEWFGLTTHPGGNGWDLCLTLGTNGGTTAAGTISWRVTGTME